MNKIKNIQAIKSLALASLFFKMGLARTEGDFTSWVGYAVVGINFALWLVFILIGISEWKGKSQDKV